MKKNHISFLCFFLLVCAVGIVGLTGCSTVSEGMRGFLGVSTKALQERRPEAMTLVSSLEAGACFVAAHRILKENGAYVYHIDSKKNLIAVYVSKSDTTPVGIFVTPHTAGSLVEVSSRSSYAKELIAGKLFPELEGKADEEGALP